MNTATAYRVKSIGFELDNVIRGEFLTKINKEVFVQNPQPWFQIYIDKGQYIGYGNLEGLTSIPNNTFQDKKPSVGLAEMPHHTGCP